MKGVNESKSLTKHTSCECKWKFAGRKCNSNQWWNNDKCWCECKKHHICEKDYIWNPSTCSYKNGFFSKYYWQITDVETKSNDKKKQKQTIPTNFNKKI